MRFVVGRRYQRSRMGRPEIPLVNGGFPAPDRRNALAARFGRWGTAAQCCRSGGHDASRRLERRRRGRQIDARDARAARAARAPRRPRGAPSRTASRSPSRAVAPAHRRGAVAASAAAARRRAPRSPGQHGARGVQHRRRAQVDRKRSRATPSAPSGDSAGASCRHPRRDRRPRPRQCARDVHADRLAGHRARLRRDRRRAAPLGLQGYAAVFGAVGACAAINLR